MDNQIKPRENWGSKVGFIMAAAGSAVGLGNIWRFPYMTGENGGGAFIILYLICVAIVGLCIMTAEFAIGRRTSLAAVGAYKSYSKRWTFAGALGVLSAFFIMAFYPVVGGWALAYVFKSVTGLLSAPEAIGDVFGGFITDSYQPLIWLVVFMAFNVFIVARGIAGGIEKAGKVLMPTLLGLLVLIIIRSVTLPGSGAGLGFLFKPDWSVVTWGTVLAALGQAFFSLSLGMGCMITYGSYLKKDQNLQRNALTVTVLDTGVAILAGLAIFPALFAFGMEPAGGAGLVFVVVPSVFAEMGGAGPIFSLIFFVALTVAALTSSISLLEVVVSYLIDQKNLSRKVAVFSTSFIMIILGVLSSLSLGVMSEFKVFGVGFFDFFDILTDKIFLAIGGLLFAVFVGWFVKKEDLKDELTNGGTVKFKLFGVWHALVKYIIPIAILIVAIMGVRDIAQNALIHFGFYSIAVLAIFSVDL